MKIQYETKNLSAGSLATIEQANKILAEYSEQGYDLTLRQLYYQFVARDLIPNNMKSYKRIVDVIGSGRDCGLIDWDMLVDRTRNMRDLAHWDNASEIIAACAQQFRVDMWSNQETRLEVWIEKDALTGVIEGVCKKNDVPYFACRGYNSQSEQWRAARRAIVYENEGQFTTIIHLGDHDPSGIDMSRDIQDRFTKYGADVKVERIALNWDQVQEYTPPPNPAKMTDSRARQYVDNYGSDSWELDALSPAVIEDLIQEKIDEYKDPELWRECQDVQNLNRENIHRVSNRWDDIQSNWGDIVEILPREE